MSLEKKLLERVLSAGAYGIKKTDLHKEFPEQDFENVLEALITAGEIFTDKKGTAYYCWHKDQYVQSLLNSDPKFRLTYNAVKSLEATLNRNSDALANRIDTLASNISNLANLLTSEPRHAPSSGSSQKAERPKISLEEFKRQFDSAIGESSSSIGWVELSKVRNLVCERLHISIEEFYRLVQIIVNQYQEKYELSTGGGEGVMVRGLLHGFVRCI